MIVKDKVKQAVLHRFGIRCFKELGATLITLNIYREYSTFDAIYGFTPRIIGWVFTTVYGLPHQDMP